MDSAQSHGTGASQASAPLRDLAAHFVRYLELRLQLFGLESREMGFFRFKIVKPDNGHLGWPQNSAAK